jgi:hypothetical protein
MRWWFDYVALKWMGFRDILAVLLGRSLESLLLIAFGWSFGYYVVRPIVRAASTDPTFAHAVGLIPPFALNLFPYASAVVFGSLPWLIPLLPILRRRHRETEKSDADSN